MVHTGIAQQYQEDDGEHDFEDPDVEEVGWRDGPCCLEPHVVGDVQRLRFGISVSSN